MFILNKYDLFMIVHDWSRVVMSLLCNNSAGGRPFVKTPADFPMPPSKPRFSSGVQGSSWKSKPFFKLPEAKVAAACVRCHLAKGSPT